ncbi:MAG: VanZ family protein [Planctomycetaceae bacterium]
MRPLTKISLFGIRLATCVLALYWLLIFTGTHLPTLPKMSPVVTDKLLHFTAFFGLSILLCWVIQTRRHVWQKFAWVAVIAISYAGFDEITQSFVRGRTTDVKDFAADCLGIFTAIALYAALRWALPQWTSATPAGNESVEDEATYWYESADQTASRPLATSVDHDSISVA